ncbi:hypothetical protein F5Y16DRAFT_402475 [Xylariaceae sp. FL0255]|nr:hypothetical protein F5Y16DRAFT_402475 [Xylariaceae sp. FL0255]
MGNFKQGGAPVVLWTYGTAGLTAARAPSAHRALWYGDNALFPLALAGYAVFAPDYAGFGISASWDGSLIPHQYETSLAGAYDAFYGLRAAWEGVYPSFDASEWLTPLKLARVELLR